ncbi:hypothetical protein LY76DRAFT_339695 [Colletotrichum caudatum]|nr:hypothetical protein LY76DRAFT_339695 [Colletotrichum caudatum]
MFQPAVLPIAEAGADSVLGAASPSVSVHLLAVFVCFFLSKKHREERMEGRKKERKRMSEAPESHPLITNRHTLLFTLPPLVPCLALPNTSSCSRVPAGGVLVPAVAAAASAAAAVVTVLLSVVILSFSPLFSRPLTHLPTHLPLAHTRTHTHSPPLSLLSYDTSAPLSAVPFPPFPPRFLPPPLPASSNRQQPVGSLRDALRGRQQGAVQSQCVWGRSVCSCVPELSSSRLQLSILG